MNNDQFVVKMFGYYGMRAEVLEEVRDLTKNMTDEDRDTLWGGFKYYIPPSKRIGVSDIYEMCAKKNLFVKKADPVKLPVHNAVCEVCGTEFRWKLLTTKEDNDRQIFERCPKCLFFYENTWVIKRYEDSMYFARLKYKDPSMPEPPPVTYGDHHRKYVVKYREKWKRGDFSKPVETKTVPYDPIKYGRMALKT